MSEETAKKLALEVRAVSDSDKSVDFDLAGYGGESARKLVASAFATPLPLRGQHSPPAPPPPPAAGCAPRAPRGHR